MALHAEFTVIALSASASSTVPARASFPGRPRRASTSLCAAPAFYHPPMCRRPCPLSLLPHRVRLSVSDKRSPTGRRAGKPRRPLP